MTNDPTSPVGEPRGAGTVSAEEEREEAARREAELGAPTVAVGASAAQRFAAALAAQNVLVTVLAIVTAAIVGGLVMALADEQVRTALGYFTARPADTFSALGDAVLAPYRALIVGAFGGLPRISEWLTRSTPLILTGLAVAIPLRAGLFNIGGEGQFIVGALAGTFAGFTFGLPGPLIIPVALLFGIVGGATYGFVPGYLKARTGAHEVIATIMLNNIAINLSALLLSRAPFQPPGTQEVISRHVARAAFLPKILPTGRANLGFVLALLTAVAVWWFLERSTRGFELTAVGLNPNAAMVAGMSPTATTVLAMAIAGACAGLGGVTQVLGVDGRMTLGTSAGLGFDGITVALLGRGSVGGTVAAGLLFGALKAGGRGMQAATGTSLDLVVVIQALIILFVASPALIRAIYRVSAQRGGLGQIVRGWGA